MSISSRLPVLKRWLGPAVLLGSLAAASCDIGSSSETTSTGAGEGGAPSGGVTTDSSTGVGNGGASVGPGSSSSGGGTTTATTTSTTASSTTTTTTTSGSSSSSGGGPNHIAPNGYYVQGNTIYDASNTPRLLHGMARPSMEWSATGEHIGTADYQIMKSWGRGSCGSP